MQKLTKVEEEIMHIVWKLGRCMVTEIIDQLDPKPPHSTISSVMRILDRKGFVDHKKYGRTHEYFPIISKEEYSKGSIRQLVSNYFDGSVNNLVSFIVQNENVSEKEMIEMLKRLKNQKDNQ